MEVVAFTEQLADVRIRYQVTYMRDSAFVWAQAVDPSGGAGSLPSLSLSLSSNTGASGLPAATTVLRGPAAAVSRGVAAKLAKRCGMPVYACVDLPGEAADVLADAVTKRLVRELDGRADGRR